MLHQVGVSFDLYYDARKHKIKKNKNTKHSPCFEADSRLASQGTPSMGPGGSLHCAQKPDTKPYCVTAASGLRPHFSLL